MLNNKMKKRSLLAMFMIAGFITVTSCVKKDYDAPPDTSKTDPNLPVNLTIAQLKAKYNTLTTIDSEWTIAGVVNADDRSGNFYKQINIEDSTGGITILIDGNSLYAKLPVGRKVYVKLKGLAYGFYNKLPQLGFDDGEGGVSGIPSTSLDKYVIRADYPHTITVQEFDGLASLKFANVDMYNRLVKINNVEIIDNDLSQTYAQPSEISSGTSITLQDCNGNTIIMRTSAYANFQKFAVPKGKGSITALYTVYGTTPQLVIRDTGDVKMYDIRCNGSSGNVTYLLNEDFEDLDDWNAQSVAGAQVWSIGQFGNPKPCALISGYASGNFANEDWLISKALGLNGFSVITLSFESASKYSGNKLQTYVSTDYTGTGDPNAATWTLIPAVYDASGNFTFTASGDIDLSSYKNKTVYIAFKYTSTTSAAATWELDNVKVKAE